MKILVEGTEKELERAKASLVETCLFNTEFCTSDKRCKECEKEQNFEIEYVVKKS